MAYWSLTRTLLLLRSMIATSRAGSWFRPDCQLPERPRRHRRRERCFKPLIGDDPHSGLDYSPLQTFRAAVSPNDGSGGGAPVPVRLLGGPQDTDIATIRLNEAQHIADLIVRVKAEGWVVGKVSRKPSYGDVAILLPTRTSLGSLERATGA
jgi:hypothetical protein